MTGDSEPGLSLETTTLTEYFEDCIRSALAKSNVDIDRHMRTYVVNLLTEFGSSDGIRNPGINGFSTEPIAFKFIEAMNACPARRFQLLREIGDFTLYLLGFFTESVERSVVSTHYYVEMGRNAYIRAGAMLTRPGIDNPFCRLFENLGQQFRQLIDLLNEVSERSFNRDSDILRLYGRFVQTGSSRLARRLASHGVNVAAVPKLMQ